MGLLTGATSLVELILKKFGDDVDGATQELVRMGGFPESVARRIATGDLPMDAASVESRRIAQGYGDELYHGGTHDIKEFKADTSVPNNDWGNATYLTDNKYEASDIYAGTHSDDFQLRAMRRAREMASEAKDPNAVAYMRDAIRELKGESDGVVYPVRVKQDGLLAIKDDGARQIAHHGESLDGASGVVDTTTPDRYSQMGAGNHTVIFPGNENQIRSVNAAFDPEYTGPNIMGGLALPVTAGLLAAGQSEESDAGFVTKGGKTLLEAFHGSPHKFDKFSMDQIGTGEGAQAYGHGLYFADSEDVAKQYRDTLALNGYQDNNANYSKALELGLSAGEFDAFESMVRGGVTRGGISVETLAPMLQKHLQWPDEHLPSIERFVGEYLDTLPKGSLYRTEIDVTPESLLDWDKPLSEQSEAVQDSLQFFEFNSDNPSGREMYHAITNQKRDYQIDRIQSINREMDKVNAIMKADEIGYRQFKTDAGRDAAQRYDELMAERSLLNKETTAQASQSAASSELDEFGIKGIKYLDGDSRAVGDGTSNYVIFDDSLINIAERGNADPRLLAGTAAGTAGLLAAGQSEDADAGPLSTLSKAAKIAAMRAEANAARFGPSEPESILDFVQAKAYRQGDVLPDTSYRGGHTAPVDPEYNAPLHDLTGTYPEDVYSANGPRYYGQGDELDEKSFEVIHKVRGNPDAPVAMYRAVPSDAPDEILPGDWVTTNPDYAVQHAEMHMEPSEYMDEQKWKVLEAETNAGRLRTDGNSPHEYGYTGNATVPMLGATALGSAGLLTAPALMKDPTAPLPAPAFGEQMAKAGDVLMTILDAPMTGWQGVARGVSGLLDGEDAVTAGAQANHMMQGGSQEGYDRIGKKVEGLFSHIDKQFPYLNIGKSAGDTTSMILGLLSPF